MSRPLNDSPYLFGLHDPGGEHLMLDHGVPGWVLLTVAIGSDPNDSGPGDDPFRGDYRSLSDRDLGVIVRLNNGYQGAGTLPPASQHDDFARRCAAFVAASHGCHIWIVGNQPNHPLEWPGADWDWSVTPPQPVGEQTRGEPITPERYVRCYRAVRAAIHVLAGHEGDQVLVAPTAPWSNLLTYEGNPGGDWVQYFSDVMTALSAGECDGITLHTYSHGSGPDTITSEACMDPPFEHRRFQFRTYQDFMATIPETMAGLPVYVTETHPADDPWTDGNTGWVAAAYAEIDRWNHGQGQQIRSLILYRWPQIAGDCWGIDGKQGVIDDFSGALAHGYRWERVQDDTADLAAQVTDVENQAGGLMPALLDAEALAVQATKLAGTVDALLVQVKQLELDSLREQAANLDAELESIESALADASAATPAAPPMQDVRTLLPQHATARYPLREPGAVRRVVVHHTVTGAAVRPQTLAQAQIRQGKAGISCHFLVSGDGTIYWTQPLEVATQQALNPLVNADSVSVALAGNFTAEPPPAPQLAAAANLIAWLLGTLNLDTDAVFGRSEVEQRRVDSPGAQWFQGTRYKDALLSAVQTHLASRHTVAGPAADDLQQRVNDLQAEVDALSRQVGDLQREVAERQAELAGDQTRIPHPHGLLRSTGRSSGGVPKPEVVDVVDSLPHHPTLRYSNRTVPISTIVIHHTDSPKTATPQSIAEYHVHGVVKDAEGEYIKAEWPGIAYHYVIAADGTIYWCQRHDTLSYHVGSANNYSLGISLIGCFCEVDYNNQPQPPEDQVPTPEQLRSAGRLVAWLLQELDLPSVRQVVGHKEVGQTSCPGDHWNTGQNWKAELYDQVGALQGEDDAAVAKSIDHYLLFWDHGDQWAETDFRNAQDYIAHFLPTVGFSVDDATYARHVVIVGGDAGVSGAEEARLRAAGAQVYRLAGADEAATHTLLDALVAADTPWPGAVPEHASLAGPAVASHRARSRHAPVHVTDEWTVPDD